MSGTLGVTGVMTATGGIELSHASQNTLTASSGLLSIEGAVVYSAGGTDVPLADGGTGASLSDPGADRILFWDDSAGAVAFLVPNCNISISGTNLNACGGGGGCARSVAGDTDNGVITWVTSDNTFAAEAGLLYDATTLTVTKDTDGDYQDNRQTQGQDDQGHHRDQFAQDQM